MSDYLTRLNHFRFETDGDQLIVTSERSDTFEKTFDIPRDIDITDDEELFERYYTDLFSAYQEHQS